jgi:shikimate 5-dehydrogenase
MFLHYSIYISWQFILLVEETDVQAWIRIFLKRGCGGVHVKVPLFIEIFKICQKMGML